MSNSQIKYNSVLLHIDALTSLFKEAGDQFLYDIKGDVKIKENKIYAVESEQTLFHHFFNLLNQDKKTKTDYQRVVGFLSLIFIISKREKKTLDSEITFILAGLYRYLFIELEKLDTFEKEINIEKQKTEDEKVQDIIAELHGRKLIIENPIKGVQLEILDMENIINKETEALSFASEIGAHDISIFDDYTQFKQNLGEGTLIYTFNDYHSFYDRFPDDDSYDRAFTVESEAFRQHAVALKNGEHINTYRMVSSALTTMADLFK